MELINEVSPPTPFLVKNDSSNASGIFQDDFVEGPVRFLIGIRDKLGKKMEYHAGALRWEAGNNRTVGSRAGIELEDVKFELSDEGRLLVWDQHVPGRVLWDSNSGASRRREAVEPVFCLDSKTGRLAIRNHKSDSEEAIWDPMRYLKEINYESPKSDPILLLSDRKPYLQVQDSGNSLWSSTTEFSSMELLAGCFIAVAPEQVNRDAQPPNIEYGVRPTILSEALNGMHIHHHNHSAPPALPPRPDNTGQAKNTWLYHEPNTSQLVLHTSHHPQMVEDTQVVWRSPNWKMCKSLPNEPSHANLQGDGNVVIYGSEVGAVWASCTNSGDKVAAAIAIVGQGVDGNGARVELKSSDGRCVWRSNDSK